MPKDKPKRSPIPNAKQFTSEYQPDPKNRIAGMKKYWEYRKSRKQFFEQLCEVKLPDGRIIDFWGTVKAKLHQLILDKDSKLEEREKVDLIMKLCKEFMPEDKTIKLGNEEGSVINIKFIEEPDKTSD